MKMIFGIFFTIAVLAAASATKKGDDSLLSVLSKERQEMKEVFQHENKELRDENTKLQQQDEKLQKRDEALQEQIVKMLKDEIARQKKEIENLRHIDRRQRDQIDTLEKKTKGLIRQEDVASETKRLETQITNSSKMRETISEVEIAGGSANATSLYQNFELFQPGYAFTRGQAHAGWASSAWNPGLFPEMVWYDFGHGNAFVPARVSFRGRTDNDKTQKWTPSVWEFVGSNDDVCTGSGNWTILCQDLSDVLPQHVYDTKFCDVSNSNPSVEQRKYRCLGINVIRSHLMYTALSNVRMWKNVIQTAGMKNATQYY